MNLKSHISDKISLLFCLIIGVFWYGTRVSLVQAQVSSDETLSTKVNTSNNLDFTITNGDDESAVSDAGVVVFQTRRLVSRVRRVNRVRSARLVCKWQMRSVIYIYRPISRGGSEPKNRTQRQKLSLTLAP